MLTYQFLIRILSPIVVVITLIDAVKKHGGQRFLQQRLGLKYPLSTFDDSPIWIHCASVGEVKAAEPLIQALTPNTPLLVTTNTTTGYNLVHSIFDQQVTCVYCPLDYPFAIKRFLKQYRPSKLWVMETEIWPNLYQLSHQQGLEISILNARLSQKTLNSPDWLKQTYRQTLTRVSHLLVRNEQERTHFLELGADKGVIQIVDNLKYAATPHKTQTSRLIERPYILLASSHDDEETKITRRWIALDRPELLVIVPRHPKRINDILKTLPLPREQVSVYSKHEDIHSNTLVYLDDQIGALTPLFCHAKLVIMGGAFVPKGGHNVLEPAACKAAIFTGPDMSDFEEETALLKAHQGLIQCSNYDALFQEMEPLLDSPERLDQMGNNAKQALQAKANVLEEYLSLLLPDHKV